MISTGADVRPVIEIRPFGQGMPPRIADVCDLHERLLPSSPIVKLGRPFMERCYYAVLPVEGEVFGAVAYVDAVPAGFVAAAADSDGFMRRTAKAHLLGIAWLIGWSVLAAPSRVVGLMEALKLMRSRPSPKRQSARGEILSIGVLPPYRGEAFRVRSGVHIARQLLDGALLRLQARGCSRVCTIVDEDNRRSRRLFGSAGFRACDLPPGGWAVPSVEMEIDLAVRPQPGALGHGELRADLKLSVANGSGALPVTVVIPCCNEEPAIPFLAANLGILRSLGGRDHEFHYLFVDDGSTDGTWNALHREFGEWPGCDFVRHETNRGVAGAIQTGIERALTDVVCSIDCDCSYDPRLLLNMMPLLRDDVDMVTASPYHPAGRVAGLPAWRVLLSRTASVLHRLATGGRLYTYTSCFRVYRRTRAGGIKLADWGFLGVAEWADQMVLSGGRIVEYPAVLEVRRVGVSKMKVTRTVAGHVILLTRVLARRLARGNRRDMSDSLSSGGKRN